MQDIQWFGQDFFAKSLWRMRQICQTLFQISHCIARIHNKNFQMNIICESKIQFVNAFSLFLILFPIFKVMQDIQWFVQVFFSKSLWRTAPNMSDPVPSFLHRALTAAINNHSRMRITGVMSCIIGFYYSQAQWKHLSCMIHHYYGLLVATAGQIIPIFIKEIHQNQCK